LAVIQKAKQFTTSDDVTFGDKLRIHLIQHLPLSKRQSNLILPRLLLRYLS